MASKNKDVKESWEEAKRLLKVVKQKEKDYQRASIAAYTAKAVFDAKMEKAGRLANDMKYALQNYGMMACEAAERAVDAGVSGAAMPPGTDKESGKPSSLYAAFAMYNAGNEEEDAFSEDGSPDQGSDTWYEWKALQAAAEEMCYEEIHDIDDRYVEIDD